jgi:hypothetical protein
VLGCQISKPIYENKHCKSYFLIPDHKLFVKNQAENPFYLINYTLAGNDFNKAVEALENKNVLLMPMTYIYQVKNFM